MDWPGVTGVVSPLQIELILIGQVEMLVGKTNYPILSPQMGNYLGYHTTHHVNELSKSFPQTEICLGTYYQNRSLSHLECISFNIYGNPFGI